MASAEGQAAKVRVGQLVFQAAWHAPAQVVEEEARICQVGEEAHICQVGEAAQLRRYLPAQGSLLRRSSSARLERLPSSGGISPLNSLW